MNIYLLILVFGAGFMMVFSGVISLAQNDDPKSGAGVTRIVFGTLAAFAAARLIMGL